VSSPKITLAVIRAQFFPALFAAASQIHIHERILQRCLLGCTLVQNQTAGSCQLPDRPAVQARDLDAVVGSRPHPAPPRC
jgi:hypothetical protein